MWCGSTCIVAAPLSVFFTPEAIFKPSSSAVVRSVMVKPEILHAQLPAADGFPRHTRGSPMGWGGVGRRREHLKKPAVVFVAVLYC